MDDIFPSDKDIEQRESLMRQLHPPSTQQAGDDAASLDIVDFLKEQALDARRVKLERLAMAFGSSSFWPHELKPIWPMSEAEESDEKGLLKEFLISFSGANINKMSAITRRSLWKGALLFYSLTEEDAPYPANFAERERSTEVPGSEPENLYAPSSLKRPLPSHVSFNNPWAVGLAVSIVILLCVYGLAYVASREQKGPAFPLPDEQTLQQAPSLPYQPPSPQIASPPEDIYAAPAHSQNNK